jgi:hypothetical protein
MQAFLVRQVGADLEHYFYWPPHCAFSADIFVDADTKLTHKGTLEFQVGCPA